MTQPADLQARVDAMQQELERIVNVVADLRVAMLGDVGHRPAPAPPPLPNEQGWVPDWGTVAHAERLLRCSRTTALIKIKEHGFGRVIDRRWWIDLARIRAHLEGKTFPQLKRAL